MRDEEAGKKVLKRIGIIAAGILFVGCLLPGGLLSLFVALFFGWFSYLGRVVPQIQPDSGTIATAWMCLIVVVLGVHSIGSWLYPSLSNGEKKWRWGWTARVVGMVMLLFTAGTVSVGIVHQTGWLITSKEPLYMRSSVAERAIASNSIKQLSLSVHEYESKHMFMPASTFSAAGRPMHSWQTYLLPFIEQEALYREIDLEKPWDHPANEKAVQTRIKILLNQKVGDPEGKGAAPSHYAANVMTFGVNAAQTIVGYEKGASNTMIIGEAVPYPKGWADPLNWRDPRLPFGHSQGFGGQPERNGRSVLIGMADGSVRSVKTPKELADLEKGLIPD